MQQVKEKGKHLRYDLMSASFDCSEDRHPQIVMKELGVTYQHATPQSMGDQWWFWNCENIPKELPKYFSELNLDPMKCVGWGLSEDQANKISNYVKEVV